jgi:hypothetical protein
MVFPGPENVLFTDTTQSEQTSEPSARSKAIFEPPLASATGSALPYKFTVSQITCVVLLVRFSR